MLRPYLAMLRPYPGPDAPQLHHVTPDLDPELFQQQLAHRAAGHPGHGLARTRPLQNVARILAVVLERAREIGVAGAGPGHLTPPLRGGRVGLGGHDVLPVLPVAVPHQHRDGRAQRLTRAYAGEPFDLVRLDLHTGAAAVAAHAPLQLGVDPLGRDGQPGGIPSRTPTRPRPCDSPAVVKRKVMVVDNNTRARLRAGLSGSVHAFPLSTSWRGGQGVRTCQDRVTA